MKKLRLCLLAPLFMSPPAPASDWYVTWYSPQTLMVDKESIVGDQGGVQKVWTLYAPMVVMGKPGEGFAYNKRLHAINCSAKTAGVLADVYYDENQGEHNSIVDDKGFHEIVPDSTEDFLWKYVCKPELQHELGTSAGHRGIAQYLKDQAKSVKENMVFMKRANAQ